MTILLQDYNATNHILLECILHCIKMTCVVCQTAKQTGHKGTPSSAKPLLLYSGSTPKSLIKLLDCYMAHTESTQHCPTTRALNTTNTMCFAWVEWLYHIAGKFCGH